MEQKIFNLINYCYSDSLTKEVAELNYQLFVMSLKSMLPFEDKVGCKFDSDRYLGEIRTLRYYLNGSDELVINKIKQNKPLVKKDELLEYKIIPIIISNEYWENIINEVLKCVVFYTYSKESILEALIISSVLHEYIENSTLDLDYLQEITKKRLIEFSLKDFYEDNFGIIVKNNYIINFEKERIMYFLKNTVFDTQSVSDKKIINYIINKNSETKSITEQNSIHLQNLCTYLYKLRKGILDPNKIKHNYNEHTDFKIYLEKDSFVHPVLGKCIVANRSSNGAIVKTKIGNIKVKG